MYNALLLEQGGGIISKSQVAPQQGDAVVMIGIGGTGIAALRKVKKSVYQHLEPDENTKDSVPRYERIRFLAIDTDNSDLQMKSSDISAISPNEQFSISEPQLLNLLASPERLRQEGNLGWMSMDNIKMGGTQGAGGVRQVGRYCLMKKSSELKAKITEQVVAVKAASGKSEVHVHIFAGISGGTGSGCFLDTCYIVREVLKNMSGHIYGYFFLPDIQLHREGIQGQIAIETWNKQNGYAAFRELDYLMSLPSSNETFEQNYGSFVVKSDKAPVDLCHLISGTNSKGVIIKNAYDYGLNVVADYVLSYLSSVDADAAAVANDEKGLTTAGHLANVTQGLKMIKTQYGAERNYHILGASSAELPLTHIGTYLAGKTYEKLEISLERHSSDQMVGRVSQSLGYTFDGIRRLVIAGANFKPAYNMDAIDDPGELNDKPMTWDKAIAAITQPFVICRDTAMNVMTANLKAQTTEISTYNHGVTEKIENPTFAANLFNQLVACSLGVNSGPTMAAELLHSENSKDLTNIMDGIIVQANERQKFYKNNLELRVQDICTAAYNYNKARMGKKKKLEAYLDARDEYLNTLLEIEVCGKVIAMCSGFKLIISNMYANYFSPMRNLIHELNETFRQNVQYLNTPEKMTNQNYCWRIFELDDIRETLDETVLKHQELDVEHAQFVHYLVDNYKDWRNQDRYRTGRCINEYMIGHFDQTLSQTVDQFLMVKFNEQDKGKLAELIQQDVLNKVRTLAAPLFWTSPYFKMDNSTTYSHSVMSIPGVSTAIGLAAGNLNDPAMVVRKCNVGDRITCVNFVSGIPLFGYQGVYELKGTYEKSTAAGTHLHEQDENWKETLPTPIPYRYDKTATKHGDEYEKLYFEAVEQKVICPVEPNKPSEYVVRMLPDTTELVEQYPARKYYRNGNLLRGEMENAIAELKEARAKLVPEIVPHEQRLILMNDGQADSENPENDYTERVRVDYFVRFRGIRRATEQSMAYLKKIDDKIEELNGCIRGQDTKNSLIERYMRLCVTGRITFDPKTMIESLSYRFKGFSENPDLSNLNMEFKKFHRYQAYLTLNKLDPMVLKQLDEELEKKFLTPTVEYAKNAQKIVTELSEAALSKIRDQAEELAVKDDILHFYLTLKAVAEDLVDLFGVEPKEDEIVQKNETVKPSQTEAPIKPAQVQSTGDAQLDELQKKLAQLEQMHDMGMLDDDMYNMGKQNMEKKIAARKAELEAAKNAGSNPQVAEIQKKLDQLEKMHDMGMMDDDMYQMGKQNLMKKLKEAQASGGAADPMQEMQAKLAKLQQMVDMGFMSQEEFNQQKQAMMSKIMGF